MPTKIAFIGVGNMGSPMAHNLVKATFEVSVFDVMPEALKTAAAFGARPAGSVADCVKGADYVITMLPSSPHVLKLYIDETKLIDLLPKGTTLIDCSTIAPEAARKVELAARAKGLEMVDAPVSGGVGGAVAGTLSFMVGGKATTFERVKAILAKMGKNIFHAGESGSGQVAKICNNMLLAIHMIGTSEALNLGVANGMDPKKLSEIMGQSSGRNWSLEVYNPYPGVMENVPSSKGYQGGFAVDLMAKDLGLATEAALATLSSTPMGSLARDLYRLHSKLGNGRLDFSSIRELLAGKK